MHKVRKIGKKLVGFWVFPWKQFDSNVITKVEKDWINQLVGE